MTSKTRILFFYFFCHLIPANAQITGNTRIHSLDYFIQEGLKNSPLLNDYRNQIRGNQVDSLRLGATRKPQLDANGIIMAAPTYDGYGYDPAVSNGGLYSALAGISQPLFTKKIYAPQYEGLQIENQSLGNSVQLSEHDLRKNITDQYLDLYADQKQQIYLVQVKDLLIKQKEVLKILVEKGMYRQTDYMSLELAIQSQDISIQQAELKFRADLNTINLSCGISDAAMYSVEDPGLKEQLKNAEVPSAFLQKFKIDSLQLVNTRNQVDIKYIPKISWFADAGIEASSPNLIDKSMGTSFGLSFSMPLYDGKQRDLQYRKIDISQNTVLQYKLFFKIQQSSRVEQANEQIKRTEQLILRLNDQLGNADKLINAEKALLEKGGISVLDFIMAIKNQLDTKNQLNQAELMKMQLINELNYWNW